MTEVKQRWNKGYFDFNWFHWQLWEKHFVVAGMFSYHQRELYASNKNMFVALCTEVDQITEANDGPWQEKPDYYVIIFSIS